jgi:hypothetical protein
MIKDLDRLLDSTILLASPRLGVLRPIRIALVIHQAILRSGVKPPHLLTSVRLLTDPGLHRTSAPVLRKAMAVTDNIIMQTVIKARRVVAIAVVEVPEWLQIESFSEAIALLRRN